MRHIFKCDADTAVVKTDRGVIRGYEYDGISVFKGVPYAQAKRFHAPEPVDAWEGVKECTSYGFVCPLMSNEKPNGELGVPHRYWPMNENCQNLNIWTPGLDDKKRPVMVWLHGGGYAAGSSIEQKTYNGLAMATLGDVVVVSINHRLNVLGYLDLSPFGEEYENSGNAGTADMIAALKWIHTNIASFGGDPENVVVFGQSGGGGKVTTLLQSPEADGLIAKGINMSGVIDMLADSVGDGEEIVKAVMAELKITDVKKLETVSYGHLVKAYQKVSPALQKAGKYVGGAPMPNAHYAGNPVVNGWREETAKLPLMVGSVFAEFLGFMPSMLPAGAPAEVLKPMLLSFMGEDAPVDDLLALFAETYPNHDLSDILKVDTTFRGPEIPYIKSRSALNDCTWAYLFDQKQNMDGGKNPWHCADIPYFFHNCEMAPATQQEGVEELEEQIFRTVMAFAHTGNPNNSLIPEWKASTPEEEHMLFFANEPHTAVNHDHKLQKELAPYIGKFMMKMMAVMMENVQH